ncbi:6-pyruvoyl-tetrahydropterin synthase-related protein [Patescibacteria group bacterium]
MGFKKEIKIPLLFLALVLTVFAWRVLTKPGYFSMHDDMQAFRLLQMEKCFKDGQIPCRWIPDGGFGFGYPLFNYYPPLPYYLGQVIHALGFSILNSVKIVFVLGFLGAALAMFFLGSALWGSWGGLLSSVLYTYAPYHSLDIYARGALNEFWALVWLPAILWSIYEFVRTEEQKYLRWLVFLGACLLLTHNAMVLIFAPVILGWLFLNLLLEKKLKLLKRFIGPGLLAVGMAAFFFLPVVFEKRFVHVETMLMGYFNYLAHFVTLRQLFFDRSWGWGASVWGTDEKISFQIGWPHWWLSFLVLLIFAFFPKRQGERTISKKRFNAFFLFAVGLGTAFMAHSRSTFIWKKLPVLDYLQFPWRFLTLVIFGFSAVAGGVVWFLNRKKSFRFLAPVLSLSLVALTVILNAAYFKPEVYYDNLTDNQKFSDPVEWKKQVTSGIFDYLPNSAPFPPGEPAPDQAWFESGEGEIVDYQRGTNWYRFTAQVDSPGATIKIPTFDFPRWELEVNEKIAVFQVDEELGRPYFDLKKGQHQVNFQLKNTLVRTLANWLSLVSWLVFLSMVLFFGKDKAKAKIKGEKK